MTDSEIQCGLTEDDHLILGLVVEGLRDEEMALRLGWSPGRVEETVARLSQRYRTSDRLELVLLALDLVSGRPNDAEPMRKPVLRAGAEPVAATRRGSVRSGKWTRM
jgi:DNA-binding CsgD family transcriptional regulator